MLAKVRSLLRALVHRSAFERDMDDELQFHLEARAADLVQTGLSPEDARRRARLELGNPEVWQDRCRDARRVNLFDDAILDVRFGLRNMRRDALLSITVIVTLALGIGATTAIFSVVNGVVLRPLPFPQPERLVVVSTGGDSGRAFGPDFVEWRAGCQGCDGMAATAGAWPTNIAGGVAPDRIRVGRVSESFFATLGVSPALGRTFLPDESGRQVFRDGAEMMVPTAVILGDGLWRRLFGSDPSVLGRTVRIEGDPCTIVGIMPPGFAFPKTAEAWVPAAISTTRGNSYLQVIARLRDGVSLGELQTSLNTIAQRLSAETNGRSPARLEIIPLQEHLVGDIRSSLLLFLGAVGLVLLIACANVANLLLAQAAARPKELAIRTALGATRFRIVRQLLTESVLLSLTGGALGLALASWLVPVLVAAAPSDLPRADAIGIDRWVLGFTLLVSIATGLLFGAAPVLRASAPDVNASLHERSDSGGAAGGRRIRRLLVAGEIMLALILLMGAGLLMRSFVELRQTPIGLDPSGTLTASLTLPGAVYSSDTRAKVYYRDVLDRLAALPEVRASGMVSAPPLSPHGARVSGSLMVEGEPKERGWARKVAVGGDYFHAAGVPLVRGRLFDDRDTDRSTPVVIISDSLARRLWPGVDALGRRLNIGFGGETWREVVGVVGDTKHDFIGERPLGALYHPYQQVPDQRRWMLADMTFVVRTAGSPAAVVPAVRGVFAQVDSDLPLYDVTTMTEMVSRNTADPAFYTVLLGSFSLLALILAAAGIYGLIAYSVTQRTHEIGIRVALGAGTRTIVGMVVREGMVLVVVGSVLGVLGALAATRLLSRFLYAVAPRDAATFTIVPLLLAAVAFLACYIPARRAARVDPVVALRHQ